MTRSEITLHGHRVTFTEAGEGDVLLLVHGIGGRGTTWDGVVDHLAQTHRVVAPDIDSTGDSSLGAYASTLRDLLLALGTDRATVVGHSLGGGIALQFAYQFPERCERLVLVSSGGLGREVTPILRAATLPGAEWVIPLIAHRRVVDAATRLGAVLGRLPGLNKPAVAEVVRSYTSLVEPAARATFVQTLRGVLDVRGQRVDATNRLYLAADLPVLLVWGARDRFIPVAHAHAAAELLPHCRFEVFENAGHFPHLDEPERFARLVADFLATTDPARLDAATALAYLR